MMKFRLLTGLALCIILLLSACPSVESKSKGARRRQQAKKTVGRKISTNRYLTSLILNPINKGKDHFQLLPSQMKYAWRGPADRKLADIRRTFLSLPSTLTVNVKLVGFQKDRPHHPRLSLSGGPATLDVSSDDLRTHLQALERNLVSAVLEPDLTQLSSLQPLVEFQVSHASWELSEKLDLELIRAMEIERKRPGRYEQEVYQLSYSSIDRLLQEDSKADLQSPQPQNSSLAQGLTIYLLNPNKKKSIDTNHPLDDYLYSYEELGQDKPPLHLSCPGVHYASPFGPYLWVDITAGPTAYGPNLGHGAVLPHTFPHPRLYRQEEVSSSIVPDLASTVWSAVNHYVWPPLLHGDVKRADKVLLQIVHMHESLGPPPDRLDQKSIESILASSLNGVQEVTVAESWLPFAHCDVCVAAYSLARKVKIGHQEGDSSYAPASTLTLLDSRELHRSLSKHKDAIMGYAGVDYVSDGKNLTVIPVFVFDVSSEDGRGEKNGILIDGKAKAMAFSDLVVAVSSKAHKTHSSLSCRWFKCEPEGGNITREVLAAVMSSGWGVADDSFYYSAGSGRGLDYRWSLGATPFGPLSHRLALSYSSAQIMRRNLALSGLEALSTRVVKILDALSFVSQSGRIDGRTVPMHDVQVTIMTRLSLCHFKLSEAAQYVGMMQHGHALWMVRSAEIDVEELEKAAREVRAHFAHAVVECEGGIGKAFLGRGGAIWSYAWAPIGAASLIPIAVWARKRVPWNSCPKQDKIN